MRRARNITERMPAGGAGPVDNDRTSRAQQNIGGVKIAMTEGVSFRQGCQTPPQFLLFCRGKLASRVDPTRDLLAQRWQRWRRVDRMQLRVQLRQLPGRREQFPRTCDHILEHRPPVDAFEYDA